MSEQKDKIRIFEEKQVRYIWDEENEKWWLSILDVVGVLTEQEDYSKVRNYWKWLKNKLKQEGSELVSNTNQLKMKAADGKNILRMLRIQSRFYDLYNPFQVKKQSRLNCGLLKWAVKGLMK